MTLSERQRKPAFSCPDPQPIRYRENRRWSVPRPVARNSGPRGIFPPNPNQKGPPHSPAGPFLPHPHRPNGTAARTVLGGGLRPPPRRRRAPPALRASPLPFLAPCTPTPKGPPHNPAGPALFHPHRPNGTAARSASTNCASAGLAVSCRQTAMTSSFSSAPVSGINTRFSAGEYLRAE